MAINYNSADCLVADFNELILSGLDQDGDEPIRIIPVNEEDEATFGTDGCVSINVGDSTKYYVEIDFADCSGILSELRRIKSQRLSSAYLAIDNVCSGASFFTNCAAILTNVSTTFGRNPGVKTVRFLAVDPVFNDAVFNNP